MFTLLTVPPPSAKDTATGVLTTKDMATIKGQHLRIFLTDEELCVAQSTSCTIHLALEMAEDTTKDTDDDWIQNGLIFGDNTATAYTTEELISMLTAGLRVEVAFASASGTQNREEGDKMLTGTAILSDIQLTAQVDEVSTYSAKLTGTGDLTFVE